MDYSQIVRDAADYLRPPNSRKICPDRVHSDLAAFLTKKEKQMCLYGSLVKYEEYEHVPFEIMVILVEIWITRNPDLEPYYTS